jgi:hypothetical protein
MLVSGQSCAVPLLQRVVAATVCMRHLDAACSTLCSSVRRVVQTAVSCQLCLTSHIGSVLIALAQHACYSVVLVQTL